jgi:microcin C transport system permease protein
MIWNYARFDFGESYFRDVSVLSLIAEKLRSPSRSGCG